MMPACARCRKRKARPDRRLCGTCNRYVLAAAKGRREWRSDIGQCIDCPAKASPHAVRCLRCLARKRDFYYARVDGQTNTTETPR